MQVAIIAPIPLLYKYAIRSKYHMALAHLVLENLDYANFYRERSAAGEYVILDNSIIELGEAVSIDIILEAAARIKAHEIILPDVYRDGMGTLNAIDRVFHHDAEKLKGYKLMAVPQGKTMSDWLYCYKKILRNFPQIDVIGIPKSTSMFEDDTIGRDNLVQHLYSHGFVKYDKEYHLLGVHNNPAEILVSSRHKWIRGVDTCLPVLCGQLGVSFHPKKGMLIDRPSNKPDFYNGTDLFPGLIDRNLKCMMAWSTYYEM